MSGVVGTAPISANDEICPARGRPVHRRVPEPPGCFNLDGVHQPERCEWQRTQAATRAATGVAEQHRRLAEHRKMLHGALANRLFGYGADVACEKLDYVAWQNNFPPSVRDRASGLRCSRCAAKSSAQETTSGCCLRSARR
jgi:hypothetical protein